MKRSIIAELVLSPSTSEVGISQALKEALEILRSYPNIELETHAMGTNILCSNLDDLFDVIKKCHNFLIEKYPRVVTTIKIDDRRDKPDRKMQDKANAVS
jgi:uncharacterized protein (TIGR00106 family)